jgi:hypothetical protein
MHWMTRYALLAVLAIVAIGCNSSETTGTTTAPSVLPAAVDHFTGTLTPNGALTFPFAVQGSGAVSAIVDSVVPDSAIVFGMSLGTWNGTACQVVLPNDQVIQGAGVSGATTTSGSLCVRIYDVGNLVQPETFVVEVGHP